MKRTTKNEYVSADISFEDFLAHPDAGGRSERSATELAEETLQTQQATKKKVRELKAAKRKAKHNG